MLSEYVFRKIRAEFPFEPTLQQDEAIHKLSDFIAAPACKSLFILKGFAGTGKTSVIGALVKAMTSMKKTVVLAAPTGRAAKVLASNSGRGAFTIHRLIYRRKENDATSRFVLNYNKYRDALFIVDEVSMLAAGTIDSAFGSGDLMNDLLQFVYSADNCKLLFLGDTAQLPPVHFDESPALDSVFMQSYGLQVSDFCLTQVVRQPDGSGILINATMLRQCIECGSSPMFEISGDVVALTGATLIEEIESSYSKVGENETIIISRSNKRAGQFAAGVRGMILQREDVLSRNDLLMVVRNNYNAGLDYGIDFIANGDIARISRLGGSITHLGFVFRKVSLYFPDYDTEIETLVLQDALDCETPSVLQELNRKLFALIEQEDYALIKSKRVRYKKMMTDPFLNALQVKSAYAVTCHKAQGGQWKHVYVDMSALHNAEIDSSLLRYLYTACTRATERLYLINTPVKFLENADEENVWRNV